MKNTAIIIPARLDAKRFPNKPLAKINNLPMIIHVMNRAKESRVGEVFVATPDNEIAEVVKRNGGKAILTKDNHASGSDRIYEVYAQKLKNNVDLIINLQGDMPNIKPQAISDLINYMQQGNCDIGTLASSFSSDNERADENNVKVAVKGQLIAGKFSEAIDFFRVDKKKYENYHHHVGIYAFTNKALVRYVSLKRSKLELERKLEQLRALENSMSIHVGYVNSSPLSVDTKNDLMEVRKIMEKSN